MDDFDPRYRPVRQRKIDFSKNLFASVFDEPTCRFVAEMIWGITFARAIRLTKIARSLEESIPERATIKRLSRNLAKEGIASVIGERILQLGSDRIGSDTHLIIHRSQLLKKHTKNMEFLDDLNDGTGKGYEMCDVIGWDYASGELTSLAQTLWSKKEPGFNDDQDLALVRTVRNSVGGRGILVYPSLSSREMRTQLTRDDSCRYVLMVSTDDHLLYNGRMRSNLELIDICKTPYGDTVFVDFEGKERDVFVHYGFLPVRLPECPDRPLWLVLIKGFDEKFPNKKPNMILTTEPMRQNRQLLWQMVETYFTSLWASNTNNLIKQRCDFEDIRVRSYTGLKNMAALVLASSYLITVVPGFSPSDSPVRFHRQNHPSPEQL
ncbi:MAG: hypothetical protein V3S89_01245 [Desulfobacterales bacterium]